MIFCSQFTQSLANDRGGNAETTAMSVSTLSDMGVTDRWTQTDEVSETFADSRLKMIGHKFIKKELVAFMRNHRSVPIIFDF